MAIDFKKIRPLDSRAGAITRICEAKLALVPN